MTAACRDMPRLRRSPRTSKSIFSCGLLCATALATVLWASPAAAQDDATSSIPEFVAASSLPRLPQVPQAYSCRNERGPILRPANCLLAKASSTQPRPWESNLADFTVPRATNGVSRVFANQPLFVLSH